MPEPTSGAAAAALHAIGATALAGVLTGLDYWSLLGGFAGALLAMSKQESVGPMRRTLAVASVSLLALFATWFLVDSLPVLYRVAGLGDGLPMQQGRVLIAWVIGYYAQDKLLPAADRVLDGLARRFARQSEGEGE